MGRSPDSPGGKSARDQLRERAERARTESGHIRAQSEAFRARLAGVDTPRGLSRREDEVARLLAAGLTTKEIAIRLGIKPSTASYHLANLYRKLRAHSRVEAANAYRGIRPG